MIQLIPGPVGPKGLNNFQEISIVIGKDLSLDKYYYRQSILNGEDEGKEARVYSSKEDKLKFLTCYTDTL